MGIFDSLKSTFGSEPNPVISKFELILEKTRKEHLLKNKYFYINSSNDLAYASHLLQDFSDKEKVDFLVFCVLKMPKLHHNGDGAPLNENIDYQLNNICFGFILYLFNAKIDYKDIELERVAISIYHARSEGAYFLDRLNYHQLLLHVEKLFDKKEKSTAFKDALLFFKEILSLNRNQYQQKQNLKLMAKIDAIIFEKSSENDILPIYFLGNDDFGNYANKTVEDKSSEEKIIWFKLIEKAQKATGSRPSKKYLDDAKKIILELGNDKFKKTLSDWFQFIIDYKDKETEIRTHDFRGEPIVFTTSFFLTSVNMEAIKGFVWMNSIFHDNQTIQNITKLAERCFRKIPQVGPTSVLIGNACIYVLYASKGLDGIAQLSRLRLKIKQNNTQKLIEKYINEAAIKRGISTDEIEDLAVEDFGLKNGIKAYQIEDYRCEIYIIGVGKSTIRWFKPDGSEQKTAPAFIKEKYDAKFKKIKNTQKQIDQTIATQRDRIDRMLRGNRVMTLDYFKQNYFEHGLMSFLTKKIIFSFYSDTNKEDAIYISDAWKNKEDEKINIEDFDKVCLWHPVNINTKDVKKWRDFLISKKIQQPIKQAFREIYILTDAEINTKTYSNRMAAHILKQHQYVSLAKVRNWNSRLIGAWDGGDQDTAVLRLPEYKLKAEFWVNAINTEDQYNLSGIWNYVSTDQIRFINTENNNLVDLIAIPPVVFSEVLRDVDLFVGVASVGNDPTWNDSGGLPAYIDYWQSFSFGNLSELAKNRKEILQNLIPRLKIANVTRIEDKFVIVKGKLRTYKIHIGSTNILMEPNDQYLCIVPDRSMKNQTETLFLPFEGDNGLSVIISKAFLLAADDKIKDETITSQINRK